MLFRSTTGGTSGGTGGGGGTGGTGGTTTTGTTTTPAQSGEDFLSLLALMDLFGGGQAAPQERIVYGQAPTKLASDIFGSTDLADLLRRRT